VNRRNALSAWPIAIPPPPIAAFRRTLPSEAVSMGTHSDTQLDASSVAGNGILPMVRAGRCGMHGSLAPRNGRQHPHGTRRDRHRELIDGSPFSSARWLRVDDRQGLCTAA
jgi:hypothetical protein